MDRRRASHADPLSVAHAGRVDRRADLPSSSLYNKERKCSLDKRSDKQMFFFITRCVCSLASGATSDEKYICTFKHESINRELIVIINYCSNLNNLLLDRTQKHCLHEIVKCKRKKKFT